MPNTYATMTIDQLYTLGNEICDSLHESGVAPEDALTVLRLAVSFVLADLDSSPAQVDHVLGHFAAQVRAFKGLPQNRPVH